MNTIHYICTMCCSRVCFVCLLCCVLCTKKEEKKEFMKKSVVYICKIGLSLYKYLMVENIQKTIISETTYLHCDMDCLLNIHHQSTYKIHPILVLKYEIFLKMNVIVQYPSQSLNMD